MAVTAVMITDGKAPSVPWKRPSVGPKGEGAGARVRASDPPAEGSARKRVLRGGLLLGYLDPQGAQSLHSPSNSCLVCHHRANVELRYHHRGNSGRLDFFFREHE